MNLAVIIPTKDNFELLEKCVSSIIENARSLDIKIHIADTGSNRDNVFAFLHNMKYLHGTKWIKNIFYHNAGKYHFAGTNNYIARLVSLTHGPDYYVFCNDDIELLGSDFDSITCINIFEEMSYIWAKDENVGTIGSKLLYPNSKTQHDGIVLIYRKGWPYFLHLGHQYPEQYKDNVEANVLGSTGAFLGMSRKLFLEMDGFNEAYKECFEDVELNLKCKLAGFTNYLVRSAWIVHHESVSRNKAGDQEKMKRVVQDVKDHLKPYVDANMEKIFNACAKRLKAKDDLILF
ncbi:MAG TPA: hypothetical protein PLA71_00250 [Saccharofermentans sp.]|nr:hypothetical protein [Saccharofermentans sp.]